MYSLSKVSLDNIKGVGPKIEERLNNLGIFSIRDLLLNIPRSYEDLSTISLLNQPTEYKSLYKLQIMSNPVIRNVRRNVSLMTVSVKDKSGTGELVFFNQGFLKSRLKPGNIIYVQGQRKVTRYGTQIQSPEIINNNDIGTLKPIYDLTKGITNNQMRRFIIQGFNSYRNKIQDYLDDDILIELNLLPLRLAIRALHYPSSTKDIQLARRRLGFDELFLISSYMEEYGDKTLLKGPETTEKTQEIEEFINSLPFKLTNAQMRSCNEIITDMNDGEISDRLLQGDVGSGKTIVAAVAILNMLLNDYQGAFMAPTEILAVQQYEEFKELFSQYDYNIEILTGSTKNKESIYENLRNGKIDLIVGTHALIQDNVLFHNLGVVVTDEQHRFGVKQRAELIEKGNNPYNLIMTATPIPRTLAMVMYGDMEVSIIDELPPTRKEINTIVINKAYQDRLDNFVIDQVMEGHQVFVVVSLIENESDDQLESLDEVFKHYTSNKFKGINVEYLHGKMSNDEKNEIMDRFLKNKTQILVSTTVIEVGINIPNATLMIINDADRFGLSQLHQLRGRVGRGAKDAYCVLINNNTSDKSYERMKVMESSNDGFYIAQKDLELRGEGDIIGYRQHGLPSFKFIDLVDDKDIIEMINSNKTTIMNSINKNVQCKKELDNLLVLINSELSEDNIVN